MIFDGGVEVEDGRWTGCFFSLCSRLLGIGWLCGKKGRLAGFSKELLLVTRVW